MRARGSEEHTAVAEGRHVVQPWNSDREILEHVEILPEVLELEFARGQAGAEGDEVEVGVGLMLDAFGGFAGVECFGEADEGDGESGELNKALDE